MKRFLIATVVVLVGFAFASTAMGAVSQGAVTNTTSSLGTCHDHYNEYYYGTYPQQHNLKIYTHWCANNGAITYRSTGITGDVLLCSFDSHYDTLTGGGTGYGWVTAQMGGYFTCPTGVPYLNLHFNEYERVRYNANGTTVLQGTSTGGYGT